jgi:hypothetical protein
MLKMPGIKFFYVIFCKYELVGHYFACLHLRSADLVLGICPTTGSNILCLEM